MTNLPRRPIDPLEPPPDSFDRVLATARGRRRRRGLIVTSSTMAVVFIAAASFALGASMDASHRLDPASDHDKNRESPVSGPFPHRSPVPTGKPDHDPSAGTGPGEAPTSWLRGRAVDASGKGIAGLYVQPGYAGQRTFSSDGHVSAVTDGHGNFRIVCPRAPVLLSTWKIDHDYAVVSGGGPWAATFVGSKNGRAVIPECDTDRITTTLSAGATVTGQVVDTGQCVRGDDYHVWLWLGGIRSNAIRLVGLHSGDTFTYSGLPAGAHILGLRGQTKPVLVAPGAIVEADVDFACPGSTPTTKPPEPTDPPPTPSITPSPETS